MSKPPIKAVKAIKSYCEKKQCEKCIFNIKEHVGCMLETTIPCNWEIEDEVEDHDG